MQSATFTARARTAMLCAIAALIPWPFMYSAWALAGLAVLTLFTADWPAIWRTFSSRKVLWAPVLFFLLYAASYSWSEHKDTASWAIGSKLAFLLLPIALAAAAPVESGGLRWILRAAVAGVWCAALYCLAQAYIGWKETGDESLFFYHRLVTGRDGHKLPLEANAVYMALYAYIALTVLMSGVARGEKRWLTVVLSWIAALPIAVFFVLLSSRTLLVLFAVLPVMLFFWHRLRQRGRGWRMGLLVVLVMCCAAGIFYTENPIRKRFADVSKPDISEAFLPNYSKNDEGFDNLTMRLFLWRVGLETVREHNLWWHGAGAGDVHYLTDARMHALGIRNIYSEKSPSSFHGVNMHNMLLQVLLAVGIGGVLLLGWMLLSPVFRTLPGSEGLLWLTLAITFALFMLQEAALQTQAGIVPFAFFSNLFWNRYWQVKLRKNEGTVKSV